MSDIPRCPGNWVSLRNICECRYCQRVGRARWNWINKLEHVADLHNQGAEQPVIDRAVVEREKASDALTAAYRAPLG